MSNLKFHRFENFLCWECLADWNDQNSIDRRKAIGSFNDFCSIFWDLETQVNWVNESKFAYKCKGKRLKAMIKNNCSTLSGKYKSKPYLLKIYLYKNNKS